MEPASKIAYDEMLAELRKLGCPDEETEPSVKAAVKFALATAEESRALVTHMLEQGLGAETPTAACSWCQKRPARPKKHNCEECRDPDESGV